jgi:hypothetical protein
LRLFQGDAPLEPRDRREIVIVPGHLRRKRQRNPEIRRPPVELAVPREHADDGVGIAIQQDVAADERRIGAEQVQPQPMADHRHFLAPRLIFVPGEGPPERRPRAENLEVRRRDDRDTKRSRLAAGRTGGRARRITHRRAGLRRHGLERLALLRPVDVIRGRDAVAQAARGLFPQLNDALGLRIAKGFEQHAVHQAEDGGVRSKSQGDGQRREKRESGTSLHDAPGIAEVLPRCIDSSSHVLLPLAGGRSTNGRMAQ